jgi:murein DD-endopeptidase MepM/ murein hydrolase activator NlpD
LKRGFPQKIRSLQPLGSGHEVFSDFSKVATCNPSSLKALAENTQPVASSLCEKGNQDWHSTAATVTRSRRVRTSAAMVGLAISMGASNLHSLWQAKSVLAAEDPVASDPFLRTAPDEPEASEPIAGIQLAGETQSIAASFSPAEPDGSSSQAVALLDSDWSTRDFIRHTVAPGETLWSIAKRYALDVKALSLFNEIPEDAPLTVGQTLRIPKPGVMRTELQDFANVPILPATAKADEAVTIPELTLEKQLKPSQELALAKAPSAEEMIAPVGGLVVEFQQSPASQPADESSNLLAASPNPLELSDLVPYRVKPGDTLDTIARTYDVSRSAIIAANNLQNPNLLKVDQVIGIPHSPVPLSIGLQNSPTSPDVPSVLTTASTPVAPANPGQIEIPSILPTVTPQDSQSSSVKPESLSVLASADPVTTPDPLTRNLATASQTYQVQRGDTLAKIARSYQIPVQQLAEANRITNPNVIFVNQNLRIPTSAAPVASLSVQDPVIVAAQPLPDLTSTPQPESLLWGSSQGSALNVEVPAVPALPNLRTNPNPQSGIYAPAAIPTTSRPELISVAGDSYSSFPATVESNSQPQTDLYLQDLMIEIRELQQRYRTAARTQSADQNVATAVAVPSTPTTNAQDLLIPPVQSASERTRPEFNPQSYSEGFQEDIQELRGSSARQLQVPAAAAPAVPQSQGQVVAVAPLGSENYEPLVQSLLGQTVSPTLPPLSADPYLPDGTSVQGFIWPAEGVLTSGFGWRWGRMHKGIDIAAPVGTPVLAAASGVVITSGWNSGGYGNMVEIQHPDGSVTLYAHNSALLVSPGQVVQQGQQIAEMGSTGYSTGPHLHFEIHPSGQGAVNPMAYLPQ